MGTMTINHKPLDFAFFRFFPTFSFNPKPYMNPHWILDFHHKNWAIYLPWLEPERKETHMHTNMLFHMCGALHEPYTYNQIYYIKHVWYCMVAKCCEYGTVWLQNVAKYILYNP